MKTKPYSKVLKFKEKLKDPCFFAMWLSFIFSFVMLIGKVGAWWITDSTAILADAGESVVHLIAICIAAFSLWYSKQPADEDHLYGHGKIAYFSAAGEAFVILGAAIAIIVAAVDSMIEGSHLNQLDMGVAILAFLGLVNLGLGRYLLYVGQKHQSLVLIANGKHVLTDMWTSISVVVGVALVWVSEIHFLDPLIAIGVALNIIRCAFRLLKESFEGLMERVDDELSEKIQNCLNEGVEKKLILSWHQLRHRKVNERLWIEVHLLFEEDISLTHAHQKACEIELSIQDCVNDLNLYITTHLEPSPHLETHPENHPELCNMV